MFCTNCEAEIVLPVLQIRRKTILCLQPVQKQINQQKIDFWLIEETMDLSHILLDVDAPSGTAKKCYGVVTWGAMAPPDFGRSVNSISTNGDRLCPPNYYWHPPDFQTFRQPCYKPNMTLLTVHTVLKHQINFLLRM